MEAWDISPLLSTIPATGQSMSLLHLAIWRATLICWFGQDQRNSCLGGDSCHDKRTLTGEKGVAVYKVAHGHSKCAHTDKKVADETIAGIRALLRDEELEVILAHDFKWSATMPTDSIPVACSIWSRICQVVV